MKYLTLISIVLIFTSCQMKQEEKVVQKEQARETSQDYSYQLKLADNKLVFPFEQQDLVYAYEALEPHMDKETMEVHFSKHHAGYTAKFNKAVETNNLSDMQLFEIFSRISEYPSAVRNNGGGYYNHLLFWQILSPDGGGQPEGKLAMSIEETFGDFETFKNQFSEAAKTVFGSGWAWLSVDADGKLFISKTSNQDNPLMDVTDKRGIPILCLDVWEHAYYLKYQNKRTTFIENFWEVVNWSEAGKRYAEALEAV